VENLRFCKSLQYTSVVTALKMLKHHVKSVLMESPVSHSSMPVPASIT